MKKLLSLSLAGILSLVGCWFMPAQAMDKDQELLAGPEIDIYSRFVQEEEPVGPEIEVVSQAEMVKLAGGHQVEEIAGLTSTYSSISNPRVMFTPLYTPWGKLYKHLERRQKSCWSVDNTRAWRYEPPYMIPSYRYVDMNERLKEAGLLYGPPL